MMQQKTIDMTRPAALYLGTAAALLLAVFIEGRMGNLALSQWVHIPYQRYIATGLFVASVAAGLIGAHRHAARAEAPWRVPASQIFLCFLAFALIGLSAVIFSS